MKDVIILHALIAIIIGVGFVYKNVNQIIMIMEYAMDFNIPSVHAFQISFA